jgi:hypothetical protein
LRGRVAVVRDVDERAQAVAGFGGEAHVGPVFPGNLRGKP